MTAPNAITRAKRRPGANIPDSQRHTVKLQLRVEPQIVTMLDALCTANADPAAHWTRSNFVSALMESETNRRKRRKK